MYTKYNWSTTTTLYFRDRKSFECHVEFIVTNRLISFSTDNGLHILKSVGSLLQPFSILHENLDNSVSCQPRPYSQELMLGCKQPESVRKTCSKWTCTLTEFPNGCSSCIHR